MAERFCRLGQEVFLKIEAIEKPVLAAVNGFALGGGGSKKADKFMPHFRRVGCEVVVARMGNLAGIVGAALLVAEGSETAAR